MSVGSSVTSSLLELLYTLVMDNLTRGVPLPAARSSASGCARPALESSVTITAKARVKARLRVLSFGVPTDQSWADRATELLFTCSLRVSHPVFCSLYVVLPLFKLPQPGTQLEMASTLCPPLVLPFTLLLYSLITPVPYTSRHNLMSQTRWVYFTPFVAKWTNETNSTQGYIPRLFSNVP